MDDMTTDDQADESQGPVVETASKKAPFRAAARILGRKSGKIRLGADAVSPRLAQLLPPLGASMRRYSARMAARRFGEILDAARIEPVIVERRRRASAVVMSIERFDVYERLLKERTYELAAESLHGAIEAARDGRLQTSAQLRLEARRIGFLADRRRR